MPAASRTKDSGEDITQILEGAKEKLGEPIDYLSLILSKLALALSEAPGSPKRNRELNDLEDLLAPFIDEQFRKESKVLNSERLTWDRAKNGDWNAAYHRGRVKLLMGVMKRNDMLTLGTI